jgi:integrase/recombinase XerC
MNATFSIYPRPDFVKKDGQYPVYLRLCINRKRRYYALKLSIPSPEKYWDSQKVQIKRYPGADVPKLNADNLELEHYLTKVQKIIHDCKVADRLLSFEEFERLFRASGDIRKSFYAFCDQEIAFLKKKGKAKETIRSYESYISKLKKYRPTLGFNELTLDFIKEYHIYMMTTLENNENTCHKSLSFLRSMLNNAIKLGLLNENIFRKYPLKRVQGNREFLTIDELGKLEKLFQTKALKRYQWNVLKYFLFGCYTGLRYQDIKDLKFKDIKTEVHHDHETRIIRLSMHKTKDQVSIPVIQQAGKLIGEGFAHQQVFKVNCNQVTNRYLKEIAEKAGIGKRLTFHCARHTFATVGISKGIPIEVISKLLGHRDLKTTMIYTKVVDDLKIHYMKNWETAIATAV